MTSEVEGAVSETQAALGQGVFWLARRVAGPIWQ